MRVLVLHQAVDEEAAVDEQDVANQRDAVLAALQRLGHDAESLPCSLDLSALRRDLVDRRPEVVFNLVESLAGSDRMISAVPTLLETLGIPFTGGSSLALVLTSSKVFAKERMIAAGLPAPPWLGDDAMHGDLATIAWPSRWITKPIYEHASLGMTDDAVVLCRSQQEVVAALEKWQARLARPCFAEAFVEGREFNLSLLASENGPKVLPPAEIVFVGFRESQPRIVGYAAKWQADAAEYQATPRRFEFPESDQSLLDRLRRLALETWRLFQLRGYARVDFRVDRQGEPWILEVNANPCLTPDAGFAAAVAQAGLTYDAAIERILFSN